MIARKESVTLNFTDDSNRERESQTTKMLRMEKIRREIRSPHEKNLVIFDENTCNTSENSRRTLTKILDRNMQWQARTTEWTHALCLTRKLKKRDIRIGEKLSTNRVDGNLTSYPSKKNCSTYLSIISIVIWLVFWLVIMIVRKCVGYDV